MADTKISNLTELTTPHASDVLPIVDTSGIYTTKNIKYSNLVPGGVSYSVSNKSADYPVLTTDLGSGITFTMSTANKFTLPALSSGDLGKPIAFVKVGSGTVTVQAGSGQKISDSSTTGTIYDDQSNETYASLTLVAVTTTQWIITGFDGTWTTT